MLNIFKKWLARKVRKEGPMLSMTFSLHKLFVLRVSVQCTLQKSAPEVRIPEGFDHLTTLYSSLTMSLIPQAKA